MHESLNAWGLMRKLTWQDVLLVLAVMFLARLLVLFVRWGIRHTAEKLPPRLRLTVLRVAPLTRLLIDIAAIAIVVPILVEPTFQNIVALVASIGLVLAFALKDYGSSLVAGLVTILENTYQPGDWIEVDGTYGEVKAIGLARYTSSHLTILRSSFHTRGSGRPAFSMPVAAIEVSSAWRISTFTPTTTLSQCGDGCHLPGKWRSRRHSGTSSQRNSRRTSTSSGSCRRGRAGQVWRGLPPSVRGWIGPCFRLQGERSFHRLVSGG